MITAQVMYKEVAYQADLSRCIDLSIPLGKVRCFFAPHLSIQAYQNGDFIGSVKEGAAVNFFDVHLNPHGNGTHTECMGHISAEQYSLNTHLTCFHFVAKLISLTPLQKEIGGDRVISPEIFPNTLEEQLPEALIIRTIPNDQQKLSRDYSGTNPAYLTVEAVDMLVKRGVKHLVLDLPSIDKETDGGVLAGHKRFWNYPHTDRLDCTITELAFIPDEAEDGLYLLNIQTIPLELDASPSRLLIYRLVEAHV